MKRYTTCLATCAIFAFGATAAHASCDELAAFLGEDAGMATEGTSGEMGPDNGQAIVPKDGSTAPLSEDDPSDPSEVSDLPPGAGSGDPSADAPSGDMGGGDAGNGDIAKDASTAPLEEGADNDVGVPESGDTTPLATSQQDAQDQQEGDSTAAAEASGADAGMSGDTDAMERAREALASGDDETCRQALEELQG